MIKKTTKKLSTYQRKKCSQHGIEQSTERSPNENL